MVFALQNKSRSAFLFRSYNGPFDPTQHNYNVPTHDVRITKIACAATAAPTFFKPVKIRDSEFVDGGLVANNPSHLAYRELCILRGWDTLQQGSIALVLSIGTGKAETPPKKKWYFGRYNDTIEWTKRTATDSVRAHESMLEEVNRQHASQNNVDLRLIYERFSVEHQRALNEMKMDEWQDDTVRLILDSTHAYLRETEVRRRLQSIAQVLVRARISRSRTSKWDRFATGSRWQCLIHGCRARDCHRMADMEQHFREAHLEVPISDSNSRRVAY